ncbi:hypothetical protein AAY24_08075 [Sedimenticola thiotaurini]|uniref:DUF3108 domain-containing protein n=2 Tax=Sedimenticola thiotaurini TaxID=1543721 RepID=A0A0F7JXD9_9GAMM|nr:hypothetical protein AAY24_08075 [Sedimenticola thiotaurini]
MTGLPMRSLFTLLLATCLALLPGIATPTAGQILKPYRAEYQLSLGSLVVGRAKITLDLSADGQYSYRAYTWPVGLAALFRKDEITEQSEGRIVNDAVVPSRYLYSHKRPKRTREVNLDFNWPAGRVANQIAGTPWSMQIPEGTQDKFSQQLALILAVGRGDKAAEYRVADGGLLKSYRYTEVDREQVNTKSGQYSAIKLVRNKGDRPSRTTFWFAPELNYLPVKITKHEKEGNYIMELISVTWQDGNG